MNRVSIVSDNGLSPNRRQQLSKSMLDYCRLDTKEPTSVKLVWKYKTCPGRDWLSFFKRLPPHVMLATVSVHWYCVCMRRYNLIPRWIQLHWPLQPRKQINSSTKRPHNHRGYFSTHFCYTTICTQLYFPEIHSLTPVDPRLWWKATNRIQQFYNI